MDNWKERFTNRFLAKGKWRKRVTPSAIKEFIEGAIKKEQERDKLQELLDYVKESKSKTDILFNYAMNEGSICVSKIPSEELSAKLGIGPRDKEAVILYYLEKQIKEESEA